MQPVVPLTPSHLDLSNIAASPVKVSKLREFLVDYPLSLVALELIQGFSFGFKLCYEGPRVATDCKNLKSMSGLEYEAVQLVSQEITLGRVAGPFDDPPLKDLRLSPVGMVPKKGGSYRLIHHLSHPPGASVNDFIDKKYCSVRYSSFDEALNMLSKLGHEALVARLDIKNAFRLLPVHKSDFQLLGYRIQGKIFVDKCLPFGCSISCSKFEKFSTFLEWALKQQAKSNDVVHYLDDFLVAGRKGTQDCANLMSIFSFICLELGVPLAHEKTLGPTTNLVYLGLEIDTINMSIRIPVEKLQQLKAQLLSLLDKRKVTLKELQSLTGLLNFCIRAIPAGRVFVRRLYDSTCGLSKPHHKRRVSLEMKADIQMWLVFLDCFNGITSYKIIDWSNDYEFELFTDSAGNIELGCGAILQKQWAFMRWPAQWEGTEVIRDITFLELVPIAMAFSIWGTKLAGKRVILHTDNQALVSILNTQTSKSSRVMHLLRKLVLQGLVYNIQFKATHIMGLDNTKADALSRQQWSRFQASFPDSEEEPSVIPQSFLQVISNLDLKSF